MEASCPVCQQAIPEGAEHCPKCGFPTTLRDRLAGPLTLTETPEGEKPEGASIRSAGADEASGPEAELNAALATTLQERMELLWTFDRDAPDATGALCEAALNEASGRVTDAQQILRSAQGHLDRATEELLARHLASLESRGQALQATGLRLALEDETAHLAESIVAGELASSIAAFVTAERRLDAIEAHWRGLQALMAQVTTLTDEAAELGIDLAGLPDRLRAARASLASMPATEHDLDVVAQAAAETLMQLHEAIPPALEQELARHAGRLETQASRPGKAQSARQLHSEAVQHLKSGRLQDAVQSVRELRLALEELAQEAASQAVAPPIPAPTAASAGAGPSPDVAGPVAGPPGERAEARTPAPPAGPAAGAGDRATAPPTSPAAPAPTSAAEGPPEAVMLSALTKKARSLAVRVRSLPSESEEAAAAAAHIHEATELLRARRYAEADAALTRLMRVLAATDSQS